MPHCHLGTLPFVVSVTHPFPTTLFAFASDLSSMFDRITCPMCLSVEFISQSFH